jgi:hypothetical protein
MSVPAQLDRLHMVARRLGAPRALLHSPGNVTEYLGERKRQQQRLSQVRLLW